MVSPGLSHYYLDGSTEHGGLPVHDEVVRRQGPEGIVLEGPGISNMVDMKVDMSDAHMTCEHSGYECEHGHT